MTATKARSVGRHHRHLLELASLLATAGLADAFADVFVARRHGSSALIGLGVALIVGTVGHHVWLRRTDHAPPPQVPPAGPGTSAAAGPIAATAAGRISPAVRIAAAPVAPASPAASAGSAGPNTSGVFWRVRTEIDNTPGRLAVFAGALAAAGANIQALEVHPAPDGVVDEFLVEASPRTSAEQLCAAVGAVGGRTARAVPADVLALFDAPTRALELAARLARHAAPLEAVLADLLDADTVELCDRQDGTGDRATTLQLRLPDGRTLTATRPGMPFTDTERARARAMAELAATLRTPSRTVSEGRGKMGA